MNLLISACLLGVRCRYDGAARRMERLEELMRRHVLVPVCPEVLGGLPTPRPPSELREGRVVTRDGQDVTEAFQAGAQTALAVARAAGCDAFIRALENGYDTKVGGGGAHLSGGERQRIAIARAMLKNAPIVILDEATAYIDPENEAVIQRAVAKLVEGKTVIVIAHRLSTITDADRIFVIDGGRVTASGTHEQLLKDSELYREMWRAHIGAKDGDAA